MILRQEHASGRAMGDLGFARQPDGSFEAVIDSMHLGRNATQWLLALTRAYGHAAALKYAQNHGYEIVTDEAEQDRTRRLTLRRYT